MDSLDLSIGLLPKLLNPLNASPPGLAQHLFCNLSLSHHYIARSGTQTAACQPICLTSLMPPPQALLSICSATCLFHTTTSHAVAPRQWPVNQSA